ncbi:MAG: amidohydrolase family protein [Pirellulaceae bacterium]
MRSNIRLFTLALLVTVCGTGGLLAQDRVLIRAEQVYTAEGDVISPGVVLVSDGKISFVGKSIELGLPATEVSVATVMPGLVNAAGSAGLTGREAEITREVAPDFEAVRSIDWGAREFKELLDQGVTTVHVLPGTDSVFCGSSCIIKTAGVSRVANAEKGLVVAICSDPASGNRSRSRPDSIYVRQPTNRMGVVWIVRSVLHRVLNDVAVTELDPSALETLQKTLKSDYPLFSVSRADFDIRSSLQLGERFGFQPTVVGGDEVYRMLEEFKQSEAPLIFTGMTVGSSVRALRGEEGTELRWNVPGQLEQADVSFCLAGDNLLEQAQFALRFGLSREKALKSITIDAAKLLDLDKQLGSLAVGKEADIVALSGDPLKPTSRVVWTMVGGKIFGATESSN